MDFLRAEHSNSEGKKLLLLYGLQKSYDMSVREHAAGVSGTLCEGWVHRMTHFYNKWVDAGALRTFVFDEATIAAHEESDERRDLEHRLDAAGAARLAHLRTLTPRRPVVPG